MYVSTPIDKPLQNCNCECPMYNNTGPWQESSHTASSYAINSILTVLGILFVCVCTRRSIGKSHCQGYGEEWQQNFCSQDVKGKIQLVLEVLDAKEKDVRATKERLKCAEKQIRAMKLSSNQVHAAILCQMVKLREAQDWMDHATPDSGDISGSAISTCNSSQSATIDTLAKIGLLESQIRRLTAQNNEIYSRNGVSYGMGPKHDSSPLSSYSI